MSRLLSDSQRRQLAALLADELAAACAEELAAGRSPDDLQADIDRRRAALQAQLPAAPPLSALARAHSHRVRRSPAPFFPAVQDGQAFDRIRWNTPPQIEAADREPDESADQP